MVDDDDDEDEPWPDYRGSLIKNFPKYRSSRIDRKLSEEIRNLNVDDALQFVLEGLRAEKAPREFYLLLADMFDPSQAVDISARLVRRRGTQSIMDGSIYKAAMDVKAMLHQNSKMRVKEACADIAKVYGKSADTIYRYYNFYVVRGHAASVRYKR